MGQPEVDRLEWSSDCAGLNGRVTVVYIWPVLAMMRPQEGASRSGLPPGLSPALGFSRRWPRSIRVGA